MVNKLKPVLALENIISTDTNIVTDVLVKDGSATNLEVQRSTSLPKTSELAINIKMKAKRRYSIHVKRMITIIIAPIIYVFR